MWLRVPSCPTERIPRFISSSGCLRRQDSSWRETRGPARRAAHQVRAGDQPQDRQAAWPDHSAVAAGTGGSGDRIVQRRAFLCVVTGGLLAAPLAAEAQQPTRTARVGTLSLAAGPNPNMEVFPELRELGWVE